MYWETLDPRYDFYLWMLHQDWMPESALWSVPPDRKKRIADECYDSLVYPAAADTLVENVDGPTCDLEAKYEGYARSIPHQSRSHSVAEFHYASLQVVFRGNS